MMKNYLKRHKEISFLIGVFIVLGFVSHDLFSEQQQNSGLINSGTTLQPSSFGGRLTCEVPIPSVGSRDIPVKQESSLQKLQEPKAKSTEPKNEQSADSSNVIQK